MTAAAIPKLTPRTARDLSALLYRWTGIRIQGKEQMVEGRLVNTLRARRIGFTQYIKRVEAAGPASNDAVEFINALTTNKTSFFREDHHFHYLRDHLIPQVIRRASGSSKRVLRLWSAACSTGEEAYSLAMLAHSLVPASSGWDVQILATDIDTEVIDRARLGIYDRDSLATVPPALAARSFTDPDREGRVRIRPEIARLVHFARANLVADPFPVRGAFHAVLCRNVMIYFDRPTQDRLVANLTSRLRPDGVLVVGHSESLVATHLQRVPASFGVYQLPSALAPPPAVSAPAERKSITVGEIAASADGLHISTLLGSCVAACLYDPVARVGGMNHFLLPSAALGDPGSGRFGVHAMELLMNKLMSRGAERSRVIAKVFGAARVSPNLLSAVAESNATFIREFLGRERIPIAAERLGGTLAREILMDTATGAVQVRTLAASDRVIARELDVVEQAPEPAAPCNVDALLF